MRDIIGQVVILTVSDADRSAAWYHDLLGIEETGRYVQPDGRVTLDPGIFSEFRAGLDHLEFFWSAPRF